MIVFTRDFKFQYNTQETPVAIYLTVSTYLMCQSSDSKQDVNAWRGTSIVGSVRWEQFRSVPLDPQLHNIQGWLGILWKACGTYGAVSGKALYPVGFRGASKINVSEIWTVGLHRGIVPCQAPKSLMRIKLLSRQYASCRKGSLKIGYILGLLKSAHLLGQRIGASASMRLATV